MNDRTDDLSRYRIIVVDDDPTNIHILRHLLGMKHVKVIAASSGEEALAIIAQSSFDLILLDILMPGLDGFQVCHRLKADPNTKDIPVIFLTAKTDTDSTAAAFRHGAVDYITKPFEINELLARVDLHLGLHQARTQLAQSNAAKDKFFSIIAHDLKNPVRAFSEVTTLLDEEYEQLAEADKREYLKLLRNSARGISLLLENLLAWARTQTGHIPYHFESLPLYPLVQNNLELVQITADKKRIALQNRVQPDRCTVYADRNMVMTILRNLIANAVKFTQDGGVITVDCIQEDRLCNVSVNDTGIGITPEKQALLFRIDHKQTAIEAEPTQDSAESGTGLGLILCKEFVELQGGHIAVESWPGQGSRFSFSLPTAPTDA